MRRSEPVSTIFPTSSRSFIEAILKEANMHKLFRYCLSIPSAVILILLISALFAPAAYAQSGAGVPVKPGTPLPFMPGQPFTPAPAIPAPELSGTVQLAVPYAHIEFRLWNGFRHGLRARWGHAGAQCVCHMVRQ